MLEPALFLSIISLVLLLVGLLIMYLRLLKTKTDSLEAKASDKANEIIETVRNFLGSEQKILTDEMKRSQESYSKSYSDSLTRIQNESLRMIQNIPQDIKLSLTSLVAEFGKTLAAENLKAQEEMNAEIAKYKDAKIKEIDASISRILKDVGEKVLGEAISIEKHEELVKKALDQAKKDMVI